MLPLSPTRKRRGSESSINVSRAMYFYYTVLRQAVPGIVLAFCLDRTLKVFQEALHVPAFFMIFLQFFLLAGVMHVIEVMAPQFAFEWQNTIPGLFFVTFYFGCQVHFFTNLVAVGHSLSLF